jgi:SRSO17 transposase
MTNLQGNLKKTLGDLYGLRTWVEYGFRQCKQELGWTDYRFTNFQYIERWCGAGDAPPPGKLFFVFTL